jgi:dTDP-4-dehydrorhamnose 3,5-epimerase
MEFVQTDLPDVWLIKPTILGDDRGYFFESFRQERFDDRIGPTRFVQENQSSSSKGVLRGLHYQVHPYAQGKLVRVVEGEIFDVSVDIRRGSPTFGRYASARLNSENHWQMFVPRGFAHGFLALTDRVILQYKIDRYWNPDAERCIRYDDPELGIDWPLDGITPTLSDKDRQGLPLSDAELFPFGEPL